MYPYLFSIEGLSIPSYPILYGLGVALGSVVVLVLGARSGLQVRKLAHLLLLVSLAIVVGGRIFYAFQHSEQFANDAAAAFDLTDAGQVFYGGLLFTIPVVILGTCLLGLPLGEYSNRSKSECVGVVQFLICI